MTNVIFPRKELEKHFPLTEENIEKINLLGTPVEQSNSKEIEIEVFPNRPDLISLPGFVRAFKAFLEKSPGLKKYNVKKSGQKLVVEKSLPKEWPFAISCIVKNLKLDNQKIKDIIQIQEKLGITMLRKRKKGGIGIYPLEKIKFPIKFKGIEPNQIKFRPLRYPKELTGRQILSKHPTGIAYANICKDWNKLPVFIDSNETLMSMPPIINSHDIGKIDESTKSVFIEATGTDLNILNKVINIIATTLADLGGSIYSIECTQQNGKKINIPNLSPSKMKVSLKNANKLLGLDLKEKDLPLLLAKMGHNYQNGTVLTPAWRTDILHEVDIIEEIAIAYGYNNFTPEIPDITTIGSESRESKIRKRLSEILIGLGSLETSTHHLIKSEEADLSSLKNQIKLIDSKTEYKILRPNLLIPSLRILSENLDVEYPQKIFEIGRVFHRAGPESPNPSQDTGIEEQDNLIFALTPGNFTEIKQILDYLLNTLDLKSKIQENTHKDLIEGRTVSILLGVKDKNSNLEYKTVGYIGEVHPTTLKKWGLKMPLAVFEISLKEIYKLL